MAVTDLSPSPLIVKALHNKRGHRFHPTTYMKWLLGKVLNTLTAWTFWMEVRSMVWRKVLNATATVLTKHPSIHELYQPHTRCGFREMVCLAPNPLWVHALSFTANFCRRSVVFLGSWESWDATESVASHKYYCCRNKPCIWWCVISFVNV